MRRIVFEASAFEDFAGWVGYQAASGVVTRSSTASSSAAI